MMNHHLPPLPHGQPPPMPPPRRQHEVPYSSAPPNVRASQGYMAYHHPHTHTPGPPPPYGGPQQHYQSWFPYQQVSHPPPPQQYQQYTPLIVSSYPRSQPHSAHCAPSTLPIQSSTPTSQPSPFSSTPPASVPTSTVTEPQEDAPSHRSVEGPPIDAEELSEKTSIKPVPSPPSLAASETTTSTRAPSRQAFQPPLPWLSVPEEPFPARIPRRRRKARAPQNSSAPVELPSNDDHNNNGVEPQVEQAQTQASLARPSEPQTPTASRPLSEPSSAQPITPSSPAPQKSVPHSRDMHTQSASGRPVVPVVPVVPLLPPSPSASKQSRSTVPETTVKPSGETTNVTAEDEALAATDSSAVESSAAQPQRPAPKSWAALLRSRTPAADGSSTAPPGIDNPLDSKSESFAEALNNLSTDVEKYSDKIAFVEPRGLVNTGNMCYMNSILQVLVFCVPFYEFLDRISRRAAHSFKSDIPLVDAMIMFMKEFRVIDAASSVEQLRLRLKQNELEQYGESFIPEYVYNAIRDLPRFRDMRRGHQQDAQEFLGFLLEELHEECLSATKNVAVANSDTPLSTEVHPGSAADESAEGWLEVGHKQKPAVTRSSGHTAAESPITTIFGGKIRSEFKVPGNKNSVTLEPYQSLQLDIGSPQVNNIIDALKGLTKSETMDGDFYSSRGPKVNATKQVFIENLPPVLVLHLKRFQYDNVTKGTQKIWKKIGYPLELEIPKEVFPPHRRNILSAQSGGLPKYRLIGVIYHHGKNASGGHYTVEVRRQDGREWIRFDDTVIRRVRSDEVARTGSEEGPQQAPATPEQPTKGAEASTQGNIFRQFEEGDQEPPENEREWSQVNSPSFGHSKQKSLAAVASGNASPTVSSGESGKHSPARRSGPQDNRDNKVAYLLFYQRIQAS